MSLNNIDYLVDRLNDIFEEEDIPISKAEILNPTRPWVQQMLFLFLREFEYSETMLTNHSIIDLKAGHLSDDIRETMSLDILVVVTRKLYQRIGSSDLKFGIMDIVEPNSKRIRKVLGHFVNFWLSCNLKTEMVQQRQDEVKEKIKADKNLAKEQNEVLKETEDLQQKRQTIEIQRETLLKDLQFVDTELSQCLKSNRLLKEEHESNKVNHAVLKKKDDEITITNEKLEKEKTRLETLVKSDEIKHKLELQLRNLKEDNDAKMLKAHEFKIQIQEQKDRLLCFKKYHKELLRLSEKQKHIQTTRKTVETMGIENEENVQSLLDLDEELSKVKHQVEKVNGDYKNITNTWNKKKSCLEEELNDYENEFRKVRQGMSEEEIAASDLELNINVMKEKNHKIRQETELELEQVRSSFSRLLNSYQVFNTMMEVELKKVALAFERV